MGYTKADQAKHDEKMARISANKRKAIENAKVEIEKTKTEREKIIKQKAEIKAKYDYEIECIKCKNDLAKAEIDKQIAEINKKRDEEIAKIKLTEEKIINTREKKREDFLLKYIEITEESNRDKLKIIIDYYKFLYSEIINSNESIMDKFLNQQYKFAKLAESSTGKAKAEYLLKINDFDIRIAALQDSINKLNHFFLLEGPAMILNRLSTNKEDLELELRQEMALLDYQGDRE